MNAMQKLHGRVDFLLVCALGALLTACGGGSSTPPPSPQPPSSLTITTTSLPTGTTGTFYNQLLVASGGVGAITWSLSSGTLPGGLTLGSGGVISGVPTTSGTSNFTVQARDSSAPPQTASRPLSILVAVGPLSIGTAGLPAGTVNVFYSARANAVGGVPPYTWAVATGSLPSGLALDPTTGEIAGTSSNPTGTFGFTLRVTDSAAPSPATAIRSLGIRIAPASGPGSLGRNDTIPTATPLSNGTYQASISPLVDPPGTTTANADVDVYQLTANGGAVVAVEIRAQRLTPSSPLDSVIEIVNGSGTRLTTCRSPGSPSGLFNEPCVNDDIGISTTDSMLEFQVPAGSPLTFYVRVLDFRGDARPDFLYTIAIAGAN